MFLTGREGELLFLILANSAIYMALGASIVALVSIWRDNGPNKHGNY